MTMLEDRVAERLRSAATAGAGDPLPFTVADVVAQGERRSRRSRRRRGAIATAVAAIAVVAALVVPLPRLHLIRPASPGSRGDGTSTWRIRNYTGAPYDFVHPGTVAVYGSLVFVEVHDAIVEIDTRTGAFVRRIVGQHDDFAWSNVFGVAGSHLFVPTGKNSLTELSISSGAVVRTIEARFGFADPSVGVFDGTHEWFGNEATNTVTEVDASNGRLERVLDAARYGFNDPASLALDDSHLWISNAGGPTMTEIDVRTRALIRIVGGNRYGFDAPFSIAFDGKDIWAANYYEGDSLTEFSAATGAFIRVVDAAHTAINIPFQVAAGSGAIWVTVNAGLAELNPVTGRTERVFSKPKAAFATPFDVAAGDGEVWVTNPGNDSVTELKRLPQGP